MVQPMPSSRPTPDSRGRSSGIRRSAGPGQRRRGGISQASQWISGLVGLLFLGTALLFAYLVVGEGIDHMAQDYEAGALMESPSLEEAERRRAQRPPRPYPLEPTLQGRILSRLQRLLQGRIP